MTEYFLSDKSKAELDGVRSDLVAVTEKAIRLTVQDFAVHDGLRTIEEQREYVARGVSQTMNSKHLPQSDGYGHAVDNVPYINGQLRWEWEPIYHIAAAMQESANALGVRIRWGGAWDVNFNELEPGAASMRTAVEDYVARRRAAGRSAFIDGPHYELVT